ncbi:hypothetical protein K431DRAFT_41356 [Polychaeton citri CBS 116435]|uniref:Secreted peptide n=1 Tax=Polychaeton citri CBS 116435 TaxID=1314669 RepID=A0A9P4UQ86_9PEZI|nr:hypothetical protein K431DRAFT_41356 [Polychaeton citri CBS 116435]
MTPLPSLALLCSALLCSALPCSALLCSALCIVIATTACCFISTLSDLPSSSSSSSSSSSFSSSSLHCTLSALYHHLLYPAHSLSAFITLIAIPATLAADRLHTALQSIHSPALLYKNYQHGCIRC